MKSIVTGGAGFIGSNLVDKLVKLGHDVVVIDNLLRGERKDVNKKAIFINGDIRSKYLEKFFENTDYVFHLAAYPSVQLSIVEPREFNDVNVSGLVNILKFSVDCNVKRFIFSSSIAIYGNQSSDSLTEDLKHDPVCPYSLQKYIGEEYCKLFSKLYSIETVCLRYCNVYGNRMKSMGTYSFVLPIFLNQYRKGQPMTIRGDGTQQRDFVNVFDVVKANILASTSDKVGCGESINIGTGIGTSINQIAEYIGGKSIYIDPVIEPKIIIGNNSKAKNLLNWKPTIQFKKWIQENKNKFKL